MNLPTANTFRDLLVHDHERLDSMLTSILELVHVDVPQNLDDPWTSFEDSLLSHLDAEEMFLLPGLAKHDVLGADRIRNEHAKIRELLAEVGVGIELHMVREEQMVELARFLRTHASMEERLLYVWADTALPRGYFASILRRQRATWQRMTSPPKAPGNAAGKASPGLPVPPQSHRTDLA
jgi:hypothetical protein